MASAAWIASQIKLLFWESMSEEISEGERTISEDLRGYGVMVMRGEDQEAFFQSTLNLDDFMTLQLPSQVTFDRKRLGEWSKEALSFFNQNFDHPEFADIFANRLHYDIVIHSMLTFDMSTTALSAFLRKDMGLNNTFVAKEYSREFQSIISAYAKSAISPALGVLAYELTSLKKGKPVQRTPEAFKLSQLKRQPSYKDVRGAVPFIMKDERLAIGGVSQTELANEYYSLLERALANITDAQVMQRIGNLDPDLVRFISEYKEMLKKTDGVSVSTLWMIGHDIDNRVRDHQLHAASSDAISGRDLTYLSSFLTSHNLYLQRFDLIEKIVQDLERSASMYARLGVKEKEAPWLALSALSKASSVVEDRSAEVMQKASTGLVKGSETKGLIAIGLGLLRGALHALGGALIEGATKVLSNTAIDIGKDGLLAALKKAGMYQGMIVFIETHMSSLLHLSLTMPTYFSWLHHLFVALGFPVG